MPAKSKSQRRLMGMALAYKRGEIKEVSDEIKELAKSMSEKELEDFATTPESNLPDKVPESFESFLEDSLNEGKMTAAKMVKMFKNKDDWGDMGDQVYVKKGNLVVVDTFYYGEDKARKQLEDSWKPGGDNYKYWKDEYGVEVEIVDTFGELRATGRHKKLTSDGIVGVELKITKGSDKPINESFKKGDKVVIKTTKTDSKRFDGKKGEIVRIDGDAYIVNLKGFKSPEIEFDESELTLESEEFPLPTGSQYFKWQLEQQELAEGNAWSVDDKIKYRESSKGKFRTGTIVKKLGGNKFELDNGKIVYQKDLDHIKVDENSGDATLGSVNGMGNTSTPTGGNPGSGDILHDLGGTAQNESNLEDKISKLEDEMKSASTSRQRVIATELKSLKRELKTGSSAYTRRRGPNKGKKIGESHFKSFKDFVNEDSTSQGHAALRKIMKNIKSYDGPFAVIAIENGKVVAQEISIQNYQLIPAHFREMQKKYPGAYMRVEDSTGRMVMESLDESLDSKIRAKIAVHLKKDGIYQSDDYRFSAGEFIAKDMETARDMADSVAGTFKAVIYDDRVSKDGEVPMMIVKESNDIYNGKFKR